MSIELDARALLARACALPEDELVRFLKGLPGPVRRAVEEDWWAKWHEGQVPPTDDWDVWLLRGGRGFGKTRAGAEWVWARARERPWARIALVGGNLDDVAKVMVEGPSGLVAAARSGERAKWVASRRRVDFSTGATAFAYSAETCSRPGGPGWRGRFPSSRTRCAGWCSAAAMTGRGARTGPTRWSGR